MELRTREVPVTGTTLHVQESGDGPSILFIHGMCGYADVWNGQFERLSDRFRCVSYDRRGHTRSPLGEGVERTVQLHADDAAELISALDLGPCIVVGSSGGARIGVDMLLRHGALLRGAVLSEPSILGLDPEGARDLIGRLGPKIKGAASPELAVDAFFDEIDPHAWASMGPERLEAYRANNVELLGDLEMPPFVPTPDELATISRPARVLWGELTRPVFRNVAVAVAAGIPGAELVEIPGASHATYVLQPDAFADQVRTFADGLIG